jgi:hypothetical protein
MTQVIIVALVAGPLFFLGIALFTSAPRSSFGTIGGLPLVTVIAIIISFSTRVGARLILNMVETAACRKISSGTWQPLQKVPGVEIPQDDTGKLMLLFRQQAILNAATTEGPTFFAIIAYMLERHPAALVLAILLMADLVSRIPTRARLDAWMEAKQKTIAEGRH